MTSALDRGPDDVCRALVLVSPEADPRSAVSGIICGRFVITCVHLNQLCECHTDLRATPFFEVRRLHDGATGTLTLYVATSMDFMALAADGIHAIASDGGPTETAFDVLYDEQGEPNRLQPALVDFGDKTGRATLPGVLPSRDGQALHRVEITISSHDPLITYRSNDLGSCPPGSPIFTADFHLVGVHNAIMRGEPGETMLGVGKRIDLCCPLFLYRQLQWDRITLTPQPSPVDEDEDRAPD